MRSVSVFVETKVSDIDKHLEELMDLIDRYEAARAILTSSTKPTTRGRRRRGGRGRQRRPGRPPAARSRLEEGGVAYVNTSVGSIRARTGTKAMSSTEFDEYFGSLPSDAEG